MLWELSKVENALIKNGSFMTVVHEKRTTDLSTNTQITLFPTLKQSFDCNCWFVERKRTVHGMRVCSKNG